MASAVTGKDTKQDGMLAAEHFDDGHPEKIGVDNAIVSNNDLGMTNGDYEIAEKKLVRKLDLTLVPMVWLLYLFNYLDRNNIAYVFGRLSVRRCGRPEANLRHTDKQDSAPSKQTLVSLGISSMLPCQS
jgi:hypothetical protein